MSVNPRNTEDAYKDRDDDYYELCKYFIPLTFSEQLEFFTSQVKKRQGRTELSEGDFVDLMKNSEVSIKYIPNVYDKAADIWNERQGSRNGQDEPTKTTKAHMKRICDQKYYPMMNNCRQNVVENSTIAFNKIFLVNQASSNIYGSNSLYIFIFKGWYLLLANQFTPLQEEVDRQSGSQ
ncbi:hypothetical protein BC941DRAFT_456873 [Chlamydoabsidia padenii]|nr:hypothetical protein BC941DRAFT_456873 [Chlamydoabsidia padenii]